MRAAKACIGHDDVVLTIYLSNDVSHKFQSNLCYLSPDSRADFCNKLSPTDLNFGPLFPLINPTQPHHTVVKPLPFANNGQNVLRILDGFRQPQVLVELQDDTYIRT